MLGGNSGKFETGQREQLTPHPGKIVHTRKCGFNVARSITFLKEGPHSQF